MTEAAAYLGDAMYVSIAGTEYQCYEDMTGPGVPDLIKIPQTRGRPPVNIPRQYYDETYTFQCQDEVGSAKWLALKTIMDARAAVAIVIAYESNTAGKLTATGTGYVAVSGLSGGPGKPGTFTLVVGFAAAPTYAPNIVLSTLDFGSVAQGGAGSGFTAPTASGGTSTYTITMADENAVASALPYGATWSGSAFAGTVNAAAPVGKYRVKVKVVDSATPAQTKYFLAEMRVI